MKIDETQDYFALYSTHTAHIVALFVKRVSFSQLIRSHELWLNIERRYA